MFYENLKVLSYQVLKYTMKPDKTCSHALRPPSGGGTIEAVLYNSSRPVGDSEPILSLWRGTFKGFIPAVDSPSSIVKVQVMMKSHGAPADHRPNFIDEGIIRYICEIILWALYSPQTFHLRGSKLADVARQGLRTASYHVHRIVVHAPKD